MLRPTPNELIFEGYTYITRGDIHHVGPELDIGRLFPRGGRGPLLKCFVRISVMVGLKSN